MTLLKCLQKLFIKKCKLVEFLKIHSIERKSKYVCYNHAVYFDYENSQEQMQKLILSQNYNSAFELALSTSDLQLVTYLCQQVDSDILFDKSPCPLSQPVLLSLIQQLSVNLEEHLELKLK